MAKEPTIEEVLTQALAALEDPTLTPAGQLAAALRWSASQKFPSAERAAEAARAISECVSLARRPLETFDYQAVSRVLADFRARIRALAAPIATPKITDDGPERRKLLAAGWVINEIELIPRVLKPGEEVVAATERDVTTSAGRTLGRREVREACRPLHIESSRFHANFPRFEGDGLK